MKGYYVRYLQVLEAELGDRIALKVRRPELAAALLSYNGTIRRGGFAFDEECREVTFRTPFVPVTEPVVDAAAENVTAVAEHVRTGGGSPFEIYLTERTGFTVTDSTPDGS
ncbi:hypothetical protein EA462_14160 [Natrarchaeobius halalkaliphilus]|uniref:Uncharacterized protein n=1 Tax=Natrarchaeobius halalkaliphilus TaxID=1679091 RepID=A0A3N6LP32_9EURY|nr:hypothetical protein [Natrarchaeobius halalkaliphilus]RQG87997.1 hypothetical protein EA462_14160 [Natrarchaeobius halalkaliphilus]